MHLTVSGVASSNVPHASDPPPLHSESEAGLAILERDALIRELIRNYPDAVVLLNEHRQVVLANQEALRLFRQATLECAFGKRPGEALECIHSHDSPEGCGAGPSCRHCGLANAILSSWNRNQQTTGECSVTSSSDGATFYEMRVTASPLVLDGQPVTMAVLKDISAEKQRRVLERLFFHDVLNTVSGLCGLAQALQTDKLDNEEETLYRGWLVELTTNLEDEIQHHRALLLAERGEYVCNVSEVTLGPLLKELCALYCRHQSASGRTIRLEDPGMLTISTDAALLRRTLSNLLKNAIEATPTGGNVDVDARASRGEVCFTIRNPGTMPPEVSARLFHRFFSTKGEIGRGLGTYSAKLFGEKYLKGRLEFSSSEGDGTAFTLSVPRSL